MLWLQVLSLFLVHLCFALGTAGCAKDEGLASQLHQIANEWGCLKEYVKHELNTNPTVAVEMRKVVEIEERNLQNELRMLKRMIEGSLPQSIVTPAFQWAQGSHEIFLNVKFSHKIDAPATLNVEPMKVNLTSQELSLEATDGRKNFNLHIEFLHEVDPNNSTWSLGSVGRMVFNIKKEQDKPSKWKRLLKSDKRLTQMHYWYEMGEKYSRELENIEDVSKEDLSQKENVEGRDKRQRMDVGSDEKRFDDVEEENPALISGPNKPPMFESFGL